METKKFVQQKVTMYASEEVIIEILSRLQVTSVIRFKCVCKSWNILLKNPTFISKHYQTLSSIESSEVLFVSRRDNLTNRRVVSLLRHGEKKKFVDQDLPPLFLNDMFGHVRLIGPCNGIICLYGFPDNIALWNPNIRDFKILPPSLVSRPLDAKIRGGDIGIGYDSKTRDLKLMQILFCVSFDGRITYQVEIYYLRTNSWRKYDKIVPANIMYCGLWSMVYKDETFCWWAQDSQNVEEILSFDMSKEIFQKTPLPSNIEVLGGQHRITRAILPLKESVSLIVYSLKETNKTFDLWVINELSGNAESWIKVFSIGPLPQVERPLGFWNQDEFIFESSCGELRMYNCTNKEIKNLGVYGKRNRLEVLVHKESLFSLNDVYSTL